MCAFPDVGGGVWLLLLLVIECLHGHKRKVSERVALGTRVHEWLAITADYLQMCLVDPLQVADWPVRTAWLITTLACRVLYANPAEKRSVAVLGSLTRGSIQCAIETWAQRADLTMVGTYLFDTGYQHQRADHLVVAWGLNHNFTPLDLICVAILASRSSLDSLRVDGRPASRVMKWDGTQVVKADVTKSKKYVADKEFPDVFGPGSEWGKVPMGHGSGWSPGWEVQRCAGDPRPERLGSSSSGEGA